MLADALRAIGEEGETPQAMAEHHKSRGNEFFKKGRMNKMYFVHAVQSYTVRCILFAAVALCGGASADVLEFVESRQR